MNHKRLPPDSQLLRDFYQSALGRLGAVTERPWHDRLQVLAEGDAARVWPDSGGFIETEVYFPPPESTVQRDAAREVFPGCPLTFQLVETVFHAVPARFRQVIGEPEPKAPERPVAEKLLRQQLKLGVVTRLTIGEFRPAWHFSAVAGMRAEVVAIDQTWHALRLAFGLETGEADPHLEKELQFLSRTGTAASPDWPKVDEGRFRTFLQKNVLRDLATPLEAIRQRQERHLERELLRVNDYFAGYRAELEARLKRQRTEESRRRYQERIDATGTEEQRRRADQIQRHEIRLVPHIDALLITGERAWQAKLKLPDRETLAIFVPRARHWFGLTE